MHLQPSMQGISALGHLRSARLRPWGPVQRSWVPAHPDQIIERDVIAQRSDFVHRFADFGRDTPSRLWPVDTDPSSRRDASSRTAGTAFRHQIGGLRWQRRCPTAPPPSPLFIGSTISAISSVPWKRTKLPVPKIKFVARTPAPAGDKSLPENPAYALGSRSNFREWGGSQGMPTSPFAPAFCKPSPRISQSHSPNRQFQFASACPIPAERVGHETGEKFPDSLLHRSVLPNSSGQQASARSVRSAQGNSETDADTSYRLARRYPTAAP